MVSPLVAKAILDVKAPDIVGSFREGQKIARDARTRELTGEALATGKIDPMLAELNPEVAFTLGEQIRARNAQDISDFLRDAHVVRAKLQAGDAVGTQQFIRNRINAIENRGGDSTQSRNFLTTVLNNPEVALNEVNTLLNTLEGASRPSALIEREALLQDARSDDPLIRDSALRQLGELAPASNKPSLQEQNEAKISLERQLAEIDVDRSGRIARVREEEKLGAQKEFKAYIEADIEREKFLAREHGKTIASLGRERRKLDRIEKSSSTKINQLKSAINDTSLWAGGAGSIFRAVPGTPQFDLKSKIETIQADIAFNAITQLKEEGGTLGQVTEVEFRALQNSLANLDVRQSPSELRKNLRIVLDNYEDFLASAREGLKNTERLANEGFDRQINSFKRFRESLGDDETNDQVRSSRKSTVSPQQATTNRTEKVGNFNIVLPEGVTIGNQR